MSASILLHEDRANDRIVVLSGGDARGSVNRKTGKMLQLSILVRSMNPIDAVRSGADSTICGDCSLRDSLGKRSCYVNVMRAPLGQWKSYMAGRMKRWSVDLLYKIRKRKRPIRFGAYGDPGLLPLSVIQSALQFADGCGWTGYTQRWRHGKDQYRPFFMASVTSVAERMRAKGQGWRTFRVMARWEKPGKNEVICPASKEGGHKTTCAQCLLCDGSDGPNDKRADVAVYAHGEPRGVQEFERSKSPMLIQIQGAQS